VQPRHIISSKPSPSLRLRANRMRNNSSHALRSCRVDVTSDCAISGSVKLISIHSSATMRWQLVSVSRDWAKSRRVWSAGTWSAKIGTGVGDCKRWTWVKQTLTGELAKPWNFFRSSHFFISPPKYSVQNWKWPKTLLEHINEMYTSTIYIYICMYVWVSFKNVAMEPT